MAVGRVDIDTWSVSELDLHHAFHLWPAFFHENSRLAVPH